MCLRRIIGCAWAESHLLKQRTASYNDGEKTSKQITTKNLLKTPTNQQKNQTNPQKTPPKKLNKTKPNRKTKNNHPPKKAQKTPKKEEIIAHLQIICPDLTTNFTKIYTSVTSKQHCPIF